MFISDVRGAASDTVIVSRSGRDDESCGRNTSTPCLSISHALDILPPSGGTILFQDGDGEESVSWDCLLGEILISKSVTFVGGSQNNPYLLTCRQHSELRLVLRIIGGSDVTEIPTPQDEALNNNVTNETFAYDVTDDAENVTDEMLAYDDVTNEASIAFASQVRVSFENIHLRFANITLDYVRAFNETFANSTNLDNRVIFHTSFTDSVVEDTMIISTQTEAPSGKYDLSFTATNSTFQGHPDLNNCTGPLCSTSMMSFEVLFDLNLTLIDSQLNHQVFRSQSAGST